MNVANFEISDTEDTLVSPGYTRKKKKNQNEFFMKELEELPFSDDVKREACNVYVCMNFPIKRKNNRKYLKFFCIYNAYRNLNKIKDVHQLTKIFDLENNELNKIFKLFSYVNTGYSMKDINISPLDYINDYYRQTDLRMDEIEGVLQFAEEIIKQDEFEGEFPQVVSAAIIIYYIKRMHNMRPPQKFIDYIGRSENMINRVVDRVGVIYNS